MTSGQMTFVGLAGAIGGIFTALGLYTLAVNLRLLRSGVRAEAIVAGYDARESWDEDDSGRRRLVTYLHPILEFTDLSGRAQRVVLDEGSSSRPYAESYPVNILYSADDPKTVRIASFGGMWMWVMILLGIGIVLLSVALLIWLGDVPVRMG